MGYSGRESEDIAADTVAALNISQGVGGTLPSGRDGPLFTNARSLATGSTTLRTFGDRFADVVNVKDFGAKGDGVSDDTAAIQAAVNAALASTRKVVFPSGRYLVS